MKKNTRKKRFIIALLILLYAVNTIAQGQPEYLLQDNGGSNTGYWSYADVIGGYKFTPTEAGRITKLCLRLETWYTGLTRSVKLWDENYNELAALNIYSSGSWTCESITPVTVQPNKAYYVTACTNGDDYYSYVSNVNLPKTTSYATVNTGFYSSSNGCNLQGMSNQYTQYTFGAVDVEFSPGSAEICGQNPKEVDIMLDYTGTPILGELRINPNDWDEADLHCFWWDNTQIGTGMSTMPATDGNNQFTIDLDDTLNLDPGSHILKMSLETGISCGSGQYSMNTWNATNVEVEVWYS